jgi:hypothetical protein
MVKIANLALSFASLQADAEMSMRVSFATVSMSPSCASVRRHGRRRGRKAVSLGSVWMRDATIPAKTAEEQRPIPA